MTWSLGASTLGSPGESLDTVVSTLDACGARFVELRVAADAFVRTDLDAAGRAAIRGRSPITASRCSPSPAG